MTVTPQAAVGAHDPNLLLQVENVNKSFPGVKALEDMRFDLRKGEVLGLVGENGAGKSTLMKLLTGIYTRESGDFWLGGKPLEVTNPKEGQEAGLSIIHQELNLVPHLTVAENIWLGREPTSGRLFTRPADQTRMTQALLDRLELALDPKAIVSTLTVAKQQMVEIAKALSFDATRVLIMDEPTAALNDTEVAQLHELIRRFITPETGVVYISHRMAELKAIADRITVIRDGHYIDTMPMAETTLDQVISKMVGRAINTEARPEHVRDDRPIVLQVSNLSTAALLKDINFELHRGEVLGFAGLMGAGRTEVARAVVGADPITSGSIILNSNPVTIKSPDQAAALGIGYLSEDRKRLGLMLQLSVAHNVAISSMGAKFARFGFVNDKAIKESAEASRKLLSIKTPSVNQLVKYLSGGNQQKAIIARWLVKDCDILIFDEPTRGIDVGAKEEIYQLLNRLAEQGKSIIMISSELPEVLRMSHRVVVMADGRITGVLSAADASQEAIMRLATHRDEAVIHTDNTRKAELR
ncbi:MAG TPA: sugar ABC transporter ATP-binding protein [Propionicimonas sp.]|jgi:ribose transport system ATP-binding protein|uniref:sugar ABC transporter ATP-binding protein n=1 Tax=Propionicimonas sp. TaxID=1955623 RepID=UPI002F403B87